MTVSHLIAFLNNGLGLYFQMIEKNQNRLLTLFVLLEKSATIFHSMFSSNPLLLRQYIQIIKQNFKSYYLC